MSKTILMRDLILNVFEDGAALTATEVGAVLGEDSVRIYEELKRFWQSGRMDRIDDPARWSNTKQRAVSVRFRLNGTGQAGTVA